MRDHRTQWKNLLYGGGFLGATCMLGLQSGCVISTNDYPDNVPPIIYDESISCEFDPAFSDYYWDFFVYVDDPNFNVDDVYVDVYDAYSGGFLETHDLVYDGGDQFSNRIYETYSPYLDCTNPGRFEFDFTAVDLYGESDVVTVSHI